MQKGDYSGALTSWNRVESLEPGDTEAKRGSDYAKNQIKANDFVTQAVAAMNTGKYADAVGLLEQALIIRPQDTTIQSLLAASKAKSAPPTGLADIKTNADHWAIYLKGLESYQASDYVKALESWESLRQYYPNNADLEKNINQAKQRLSTEGGRE